MMQKSILGGCGHDKLFISAATVMAWRCLLVDESHRCILVILTLLSDKN